MPSKFGLDAGARITYLLSGVEGLPRSFVFQTLVFIFLTLNESQLRDFTNFLPTCPVVKTALMAHLGPSLT